MALSLTSCEYAREPGFSRTECLDLARRIEFGDSIWDDIDCDQWNCCGTLKHSATSPRELQTILAALRAYAG